MVRKYQLAVSKPGIPYYTYDEMQQDIVALQAEYPAFMHVRSLGKSVEGCGGTGYYRGDSGR